jgi:hypothetical protein
MAQNSRILSLNDYTYEYIKRLQHRGLMLELDPTTLPYSYGQVKGALRKLDPQKLNKHEQSWVERIKERVHLNDDNEPNEMGAELTIATRLSDTQRQDALRPLNQKLYAYPYPTLTGYIEEGNFVGQFHFRHDFYYDQDPDGIDAALRLYIRAEESYVGYQSDNVRVMLGRFHNQWGVYDEASSVVSTNARSFDQLNLSLGGKYFSFQSILGELNGLSADESFSEFTFREGSLNRFIAMHRLNWRPSKHLRLTFFESVVYSGNNSGISLKYSNPLLLYSFVVENAPKNDENNLLIGGMIWGQFKNITLNSQLMIDDFEHTRNVGEPTTFTFLSSLNYAMKRSAVDLRAEFEAVAYQSYNTDLAIGFEQPEGRYLYLNRGIATPTNDYVKLKLYPNFYLDQYVTGLKVSPYLTYFLKGEQVINQPFARRNPDGSVIDIILTGEVEKTIRGGLHILYQPKANIWFELDTGYNHFSNYNHVAGASNSRWVTLAKAGFRIALYGNN